MSEKTFTIVSPISGIFYRTPNPDSAPYVEVGSKVKAGDTLGLVEQMKVFTEILTDKDAIVHRILVNQEDTVQEKQALFELERV